MICTRCHQEIKAGDEHTVEIGTLARFVLCEQCMESYKQLERMEQQRFILILQRGFLGVLS